jgi:hypothetical protein
MVLGGFFFDFDPFLTRSEIASRSMWDRGEGRCWGGPERSRDRPRRRRRGAGASEALEAVQWCTGAVCGCDEVARASSGGIRRRAAPGRVRRCVNRVRHARRRGGGPGCGLEARRASRRRRGHVVPLKVVCVRKTTGRFDAVAVPFAYIGRVLYMRTFCWGD